MTARDVADPQPLRAAPPGVAHLPRRGGRHHPRADQAHHPTVAHAGFRLLRPAAHRLAGAMPGCACDPTAHPPVGEVTPEVTAEGAEKKTPNVDTLRALQGVGVAGFEAAQIPGSLRPFAHSQADTGGPSANAGDNRCARSRTSAGDGRDSATLPPLTADLFINGGTVLAECAVHGRASQADVEAILSRAVAQAGRLLVGGAA